MYSTCTADEQRSGLLSRRLNVSNYSRWEFKTALLLGILVHGYLHLFFLRTDYSCPLSIFPKMVNYILSGKNILG